MTGQITSVQPPPGLVFNIQRYSVHDGPGIRTIVFLKGCPLACRWCSNPESQRSEPELALNATKCIGDADCGLCRQACSQRAIKSANDGKIAIDRKLCVACFSCVDACPAKALHIFGKQMTVNEVLKAAEDDGVFYGRSGGGITLSGGEPLAQGTFIVALLKEARRRRMNTAMETCGMGDWAVLTEATKYLNTIIFDIKTVNIGRHKEYTGVGNETILANFTRLCEEYPELPKLVRTPVVPGFNDSEEDIAAIAGFLAGRANINYELLAYHRMGNPKYRYLDRDYPLGDIKLDDERFKSLKQLAKERLGKQ
jgi:pyruvate formate lyase activating enzyme